MAAGREGPVAIAVSGGSDSLALLLTAHDWAKVSGRDLLVLTVDHGLRPEAVDEAKGVAARSEALGHASRILTWRDGAPSQVQARKARHGLLARAARNIGAELLLLGHTRTDVEETMLMRLARPTRLPASIGPQPVSVSPVWPEGRGLLIGRPLIGVKRAMIMSSLAQAGEAWVSDPSNESDAYERVRIRKLSERLDPARLHKVTSAGMILRAVEDVRLAGLVEQRARVDADGLMSVDLTACEAAPPVMRRFLALLLLAASGDSRSAAAPAVQALAEDIAAGGPASRLTLGGGWVQRRGGTLLIGRDPGEARLEWRGGIWDGRYQRGARLARGDALPFLVRHSVPDEPWEEIVSGRLALWAEALRLGADIAAELASHSPGSPLSMATTHPA
jgi:tRNA(Ile)-lysidine synthase